MTNKKIVQDLLSSVDIKIGGSRPWDVTVVNDRAYDRLMRDGWIGLGESYMDGDWDCKSLDQATVKILKAGFEDKIKRNLRFILQVIKTKLVDKGKYSKAFEVAEKHYNLGNDLFRKMLDKRMVYTCAYWKDAKNLDQAQEAKLELICKKLYLKPGMKVLDIGGGWGSFAKYAAEKYKVSVVNITVSKEQIKLANQLCKGLPVKNKLLDYRDIKGVFNRVVSIGMFEQVTESHFRTFMEIIDRCLKDDGLFLLHTIGVNTRQTSSNSWIAKYIFPNGQLPSFQQLAAAFEGIFVVEDWHNFRADYDKTLMEWYKNFEKNWRGIKDNYNERFHRMWRLYLLGSAGKFRARELQLWQIVLSKNGLDGGYTSIR